MTNLQFIVSGIMLSGFVAMTFERIGAAACLMVRAPGHGLMGCGILIISYFG